MKIMLMILFLCCATLTQGQKTKLRYSDGSPTSLGIDAYINNVDNQDLWLWQYQELLKDTLYNDIWYSTENFKKVRGKDYNQYVLAYTELSANSDAVVHIDNQENYRGIRLTDTQYYTEDQYFLMSTVYHEISHYYFYQCQIELQRIKHQHVDEYWCRDLILLPQAELRYGAHFIEEGLCQYLVQRWGESPEFRTIYYPVDQRDFSKKDLDFDIVYKYASKYLKPYLDSCIIADGRVKPAIFQILEHRPPNYKEILEPRLYFKRLKVFIDTDTIPYEFKTNHN